MENEFEIGMSLDDFREKLSPFFTEEQIEKLNEWGLESAKGVHSPDPISENENLMAFCGRWFTCEFMSYWVDYEDPDGFEQMFGFRVSSENLRRLCAQFQIEF